MKYSLIILLLISFSFAQWGAGNKPIKGSANQPAKQDRTTNSLTIIDYSHYEIHEGKHFKGGFQDVTMSTDDTVFVLFTTPNTTKWAHWKLTSESTGSATIEIYENVTTSDDGTALTEWNRNRNSTNTASVVITHTPTITSFGTKMASKWIGGAGFKTDISGEHRGDSEFILKQNTKYLVIGIALASNIKIAIGGDWYEHTDE